MEGIEEIYHLADVVTGIKYVFANQTQVFHDNALIDTNILKVASHANVLFSRTLPSYSLFNYKGHTLSSGNLFSSWIAVNRAAHLFM